MLRSRLTLAAVLAALVTLPLHADPREIPTAVSRPSLARLRPQSPRIRAWLERGLDRSPTVRALAARIARSDVIVYLEVAPRLDSGVAACVTWMGATPGARYVRVSVRPTLREADGIAMVAHELQHVVEVIEHPEVQSSGALIALYERIGQRSGSSGRTWDTAAAFAAGTTARLDVVRGSRAQPGA